MRQSYHKINQLSYQKRRLDCKLVVFKSEKKLEEVLTTKVFYKQSQHKRHNDAIKNNQLTGTYL